MPTRMIREGLIDSERYANLSDQGKLFFIHLMLLADDFGCISLSPTYLRRRCFYDAPSNERIAKLVCELVDGDLIRTYEVDRRALAFIPRFGQRLNRASLKHPVPPSVLYADDLDASCKFNEITKKSPAPVRSQYRASTVLAPPEVEVKEVEGREVEVKPVDNSTRLAEALERLKPKTII